MNYAGARYFDPFFGMWMSPDPAGQFANPYTYGGDPMNYVDPNGEWVHIVVGAIIGAVVGTVNGAIQCTAPGGGGSCTKSVTTGFVGGAAVGAAAAATGGAAADAVGVGLGGAIAGGAAGGAVGGLGNYATNAFVSGSGVSWSGAWDATWKGAAAGAVSGAAGQFAGQYMDLVYSKMVGGFAGGTMGSALNDGSGWQILQGGLMGAGMSLASHVVAWSVLEVDLAISTANNQKQMSIAQEKTNAGIESTDEPDIDDDPYTKGSGNECEKVAPRKMSAPERKMFEDFQEIMSTPKAQASTEVAQGYKLGYRFGNLLAYADRVGETGYFNSTSNTYDVKGANAVVHSHPHYAFPSNKDLSSIGGIHGYIYYKPTAGKAQLYHYDSSKQYRYLY